MLFLFLACTSSDRDNPDDGGELGARDVPIEKNTLVTAKACVAPRPNASTLPPRIPFLYAADANEVFAQTDLKNPGSSSLRCGDVTIGIPPGSSGVPLAMDLMPAEDGLADVAELRLYANAAVWSESDPYVVATHDGSTHRYVLSVSLVPPPTDPSANPSQLVRTP